MNPEYIAFMIKTLETLAEGLRSGRIMPDAFETSARHGAKELRIEWSEPVVLREPRFSRLPDDEKGLK